MRIPSFQLRRQLLQQREERAHQCADIAVLQLRCPGRERSGMKHQSESPIRREDWCSGLPGENAEISCIVAGGVVGVSSRSLPERLARTRHLL
jgi:hypothetical protein